MGLKEIQELVHLENEDITDYIYGNMFKKDLQMMLYDMLSSIHFWLTHMPDKTIGEIFGKEKD